MVKSQESQDG